MIIKSPRANKNWDRWKKDDWLQEENEEFQKLFVLSSIVAAKEKQWKTALKEHQKFNDVKCFLQMRRPWKIFILSSIPAFNTRGCDLIIWRVLIHLCISHSKPFFLKTSGDTLGSFLCIYLKCMLEVQWLTSTSLLDIHDWIRYG